MVPILAVRLPESVALLALTSWRMRGGRVAGMINNPRPFCAGARLFVVQRDGDGRMPVLICSGRTKAGARCCCG